MMNSREVSRLRKNLLSWFRQFRRDLPWRRTSDPYRIWLSEIMLQQTRVAAAIPYYERFLEHFPTVKDLAEAPSEEVLRLWAGLGYYTRARNLQAAARQIVAKHSGKFPSDPHEALDLAGIGSYTAAAVLSIAYGQKLAVLDGNVARVVARLTAMKGDLRAGANWKKLQSTADQLLDVQAPGDWNQAMMELGATLCTPRSPQCLLCPVNEFCEARKLGLVDSIPAKRKLRDTVDITLAAAVFLDPESRTFLLPPPTARLLQKSHDEVAGLLSRMWHFPTIRVASDPIQELREHLQNLLPRLRSASLHFATLKAARHAVTYRNISIQPFAVHVKKLPHDSSSKILSLSDLSSVPVSNLTRKIARAAAELR
ncbi:MAG TPA: A/G-specific adenine glycosylase [Candidatus Acidoferrum sp.]